MDTGLGRDGYSIIGQGRIDEILSLKSEDRREIFEEAAGITKFRYRKEEAERKLAATEDNLARIRDLYDELERQVGPLEKQSEKAKQFLLLRDELRVLEISLWLLTLDRIKADTAKLEMDTQTCTAQLAQAKQAQEALYAPVRAAFRGYAPASTAKPTSCASSCARPSSALPSRRAAPRC